MPSSITLFTMLRVRREITEEGDMARHALALATARLLAMAERAEYDRADDDASAPSAGARRLRTASH